MAQPPSGSQLLVTINPEPRQLSDNNPQGTALGQSATDAIAFYTSNPAGGSANPQPVQQAQGNQYNTPTRGLASGLVMTFASSQTPSSVATLTTAEQSFTVQSGTGSVITPASGDLFIVNKPTAQAGIGVGNVRYSAAGVVGVTFNNFTAGTLTPTGAQIYGVIGVRGLDSITAVLTPAAVASNTTAEQLFTIAGISINRALAVNKPTSQAGLDVVNVRAAADDQVGITFLNVTAGTLTPTAAETYTFFSSPGVETEAGIFHLALNATATPATVAAATTADVTLTSANVLVNDTCIAMQKPTLQAGLALCASRVSAASTLKATYVNPTAGVLSPTASEVYVATMMRPILNAPAILYSPTLTPSSVAANTTAEQTFAVTGIVASSAILVNKPSLTPGIGIVGYRVSSAGNIAITYCNATAAAITPPSEQYEVLNLQAPIDTTAGNAMIQEIGRSIDTNIRFGTAMYNALGPNGVNLFKGG